LVPATTPGATHSTTPVISTIPGLHILANFSLTEDTLLRDYTTFRSFIDDQIGLFGLAKVGDVYHNFPGGGYTAVVCLTESHLSVHTWPELGYVTFDVFLSNYLKDNRATTRAVYSAVRDFFGGKVVFEQTVER